MQECLFAAIERVGTVACQHTHLQHKQWTKRHLHCYCFSRSRIIPVINYFIEVQVLQSSHVNPDSSPMRHIMHQ